VAFQRAQFPPGFHIPHLQRFVPRSGGRKPTIRTHCHAINVISVAFQCVQFPSAFQHPTPSAFCLAKRRPHAARPHSPATAIDSIGGPQGAEFRDKTLMVWDVESGRELHTLKGHADHVNGVAVSGGWSACGLRFVDKTLKVWDVETGRELRTLEGHSFSVNDVAVSADGRRAVSASYDGTLRCGMWKAGGTAHAGRHSSFVNGVAVGAEWSACGLRFG